MSRALLIVGGLGGLAYWAHRKGLFPQAAPLADMVDGIADRVTGMLDQSTWGRGDQVRAQESAAIKEAMGGEVVPILAPSEVVEMPTHEAMLRKFRAEVSGWAMRNIGWASAICAVENRGMNPTISGDNGTSHGVLQVKVATAETCARSGYRRHPPTKQKLLTFEGGIYFGTAEMERLAGMGRGLDWTICAYNGGQGWEHVGEQYKQDRLAYLAKVKREFSRMYGGKMA